ncbi:MAG: FAD-dependent monooxygenase [Geminicoccaceae bacterium]
MEQHSDIIVVGAGHAGLTLALACAGQKRTVTLIDPAAQTDIVEAPFDGRALALMAGSQKRLDRLGVWPTIAPVAWPVRQAEVTDMTTGVHWTHRARDVGEPALAFGVETRRLRAVLMAAAIVEPRIRIIDRVSAKHLHADGGTVALELDDGRRLGAALLVGADGRGSTVRDLAGIKAEITAYPQSALTFAVTTDDQADGISEFLRPEGPIAALPIDQSLVSLTWVDGPAQGERRRRLDDQDLAAELAAATNGRLSARSVQARPMAYRLSQHHADRYVDRRVALIGDAAHGVHPLHAQGFNMAVADIDTLVTKTRENDDPGRAASLKEYEREARPANRFRIAGTDWLNRLYGLDGGMAAMGRGALFDVIDATRPLKRAAMTTGLGLN